MTPQRIAILRKQLAQLEAERADRVRRGASVPVWFDHMIERRRAQLTAAELHSFRPAQATGKALTAIGGMYGIRRRWFGLEPDARFRKRVYAGLTARALPELAQIQRNNRAIVYAVGVALLCILASVVKVALQ